MSAGILQNIQKLAELEIQRYSAVPSEFYSEHPTVEDLVLPGTGQTFSDEFACLLSVLS